MRLIALVIILGFAAMSVRSAEPVPGTVTAATAGAKADGATDDTAALQQALDTAAKTGGTLYLPPGRYLVKGSLRVPPNVTVQGAMESPVWSEPLKGSVVLATGGHDAENGPALFELVLLC